MSDRKLAALGIAANVLFWSALIVFAALRPDYSHVSEAVSELGSWDAPNMWAWNVAGFIAPGALLGLFGWGLARRVSPRGWTLALLLALAGAGLVVAGLFPADMDDFQSTTTIGHLAGSNGSILGWASALVILAFAARKTWPALAIVSVAALILMVATFALYDSSFATRAIVQRLTFGIFFGWYLAASILLLKRATFAVEGQSSSIAGNRPRL